jgi:nickel-dependent lactate racemase
MPEPVIGRGVRQGALTLGDVNGVAREALAALPLDGRRVLVIIPDGTRTMPMPLMFATMDREVGPRVAALDFLVALGTHTPMTDAQLTAHLGHPVENGRASGHRIFNHRWDDPATYAPLGVIPAREIADLTGGRLREDVPVTQSPGRRVRPRARLRTCVST